MTELNTDALLGIIVFSVIIGIFVGLTLSNVPPSNTEKIEFSHEYLFTRPGDKLQVNANKTHKVLEGCFSRQLDSEYYRTRYNSNTETLTVLKVKGGGQEAFFGDTFEECVVPRNSSWHPEYPSKTMELRNGDTLHYQLRLLDGEWHVINPWTEEK